jgi:chromosomal replication initiator protein
MHPIITDDKPTAAEAQVHAIIDTLANHIGPHKFRIWFKDTTRFIIEHEYLKVHVSNTFSANWIEKHFINAIYKASQEILGYRPNVTFSVTPQLTARQRSPYHPSQNGPTPPVPSKPYKKTPGPLKTHSKARMTLDTFIVGSSNELAYNAAKAVVREQQSPFNPLFIHGGYGVGKTHLLQGICHAVDISNMGLQWIYVSAEDFANQFILSLKTKKLETFRRRMRQTDLLAIDDIHFFANKPSTQEEFLHTFNAIDLAGKQVVLVSDAAPKMIHQLSEKLVNRFISGMVVKIDPPDFPTRCEICRQYAMRMANSTFTGKGGRGTRKTSVPENVIQYIAQHVRTNVRELEGALLKVIAYASLQHETISLATAEAILAEHLERCDPMIHITDIESAVASYFGTTTAHIHSSKKDKTVSLARHFGMFLARKHTKMSSSEIGRLMGNKNHATVLVACKKIDDLVKRNAEIHWRGPSGNRVVKARTALDQLEDMISGQA